MTTPRQRMAVIDYAVRQVGLLRTPQAIIARDSLAWHLRNPPPGHPVPSYPEIAATIGYRSHSSAMQACIRHAARMIGNTQ